MRKVREPRDRMNAGRHDAVTEGQDMAGTLAEKVWDAHVVRRAERRARPALHRPPSHPRGDQPAGVRRAAAGGPEGPPARPDHRDRGPQRPDLDIRPRSPTSSAAPRSRRCARNCAEFGVRLHPLGRRRPGHRARRRPAARADPAGHDRGLRRLATPRRTARSARWRSGSARARSSTCWPPRRCRSTPSGPWRSPSTASCPAGVTAKDVILAVIAKIGTGRRPGLRPRVPGAAPSGRCPWKPG